jgi:cytochrome P450
MIKGRLVVSELYDPGSHTLQDNPYGVYQQLRDAYPVYWNETSRFWALTRFSDVVAAAQNYAVFSSAGRWSVPSMLTSDPPRHGKLRGLVSAVFTPKRMAEREPSIRALAISLIAAFRGRRECDLVAEFANPLPMTVITQMLGVPAEDRQRFRRWSEAIVSAAATYDPAKPRQPSPAVKELFEYFGAVIAERMKRAQDDLISDLLRAEVDGQRLTSEEVLGFCFLLLVAGNQTTTDLIANLTVQLAQHPDVYREVAGDLRLLPNAIDELLRYDSPVQMVQRTLTRDVSIHGTTMHEGDTLALVLGAANRDERQFLHPDIFDIHRQTKSHLAFGHGIHACLGAALARLEARVALEELLPVLGDFALAGNPERLYAQNVRGLRRLPIRFQGV